MKSKRTIKPTKIFDNSVTGPSRNKNAKKNGTKKSGILVEGLNDMESISRLDGSSESGKSNGNRGNEDTEKMTGRGNDEIQGKKSNVGEDLENSNIKECFDVEGDIEKRRTYAIVVNNDVMIADNKLSFIPTELNEEGSEVVIFDEALVDKGSAQWKLTVYGKFVGYKMSVHELRNEAGMNKSTEGNGLKENMWLTNLSNILISSLDITNEEIKEAMFGIGNDKALGPDGFTSVFFKRSWNIMGEDVCDAIKEFFKTNRLLGEVNATLITLVPKIQHPNKVSDFRPIACCNVILCVNGKRHGYFKSGRGLRHGDPMSPYLFTLVMEVLTLMVRVRRSQQFKFHWGCKELNLTQLCFADDLLMLSNGDHNVNDVEKKRILEVMPFTVGKLPMKYLGVPLITKTIGVTECNQLVERVKQKVVSPHIVTTSNVVAPTVVRTNDGFQTVGTKKKKKKKKKKGKSKASNGGQFAEEDDDEVVENVYDESANIFTNSQSGESCSFTSEGGLLRRVTSAGERNGHQSNSTVVHRR
nr:hypothetical protein [Tanacetum cinerariifolium]